MLCPFTKEDRQWLDAAVVKEVHDVYSNWNKYGRDRGVREPNLTAVSVRELIEDRTPVSFKILRKSKRNSLVLNALKKARRHGVIGSSIGVGLRGGEARCYEPIS